jgi:hypothetical protein
MVGWSVICAPIGIAAESGKLGLVMARELP